MANFEANFRNTNLRNEFQRITGLKPDENKEAFISFLTCGMADSLAILVSDSVRVLTRQHNEQSQAILSLLKKIQAKTDNIK